MTTNAEMISPFLTALGRQSGPILKKRASVRKELLLKHMPPEWNTRALTQSDFYLYCIAEGIELNEIPIKQNGCYLVYNDTSFIFISDKLRGAEKLLVCFHELGHFWLHPPGSQFSADGKRLSRLKNVIEIEADVVAACAMIPQPALKRYQPEEIAQLYGYPLELVEMRLNIFDQWQI